jgi:type VI secretion system secreted protein Hcp
MALVDMFLKLEGVSGESTDPKNTVEIQIDGFRLKAESPRDAYTNVATGAVRMSTLTIHGRIEQATAKLFEKTANHTKINKATLTCRKAGKQPVDFLIVELTDVVVVRVEAGDLGGGDDVIPPCEFDLAYAKLTVKSQGQTAQGQGTGFMVFDFNLAAKS